MHLLQNTGCVPPVHRIFYLFDHQCSCELNLCPGFFFILSFMLFLCFFDLLWGLLMCFWKIISKPDTPRKVYQCSKKREAVNHFTFISESVFFLRHFFLAKLLAPFKYFLFKHFILFFSFMPFHWICLSFLFTCSTFRS